MFGYDRRHPWFGLRRPFDMKFRAVTSGILHPHVLFFFRLVVAVYMLASCIIHLILELKTYHQPGKSYFVYFPRLCFIGVTAYFVSAAFQTAFFVLSLRQLLHHRRDYDEAPWYPLQYWGRFFQFLYWFLYACVMTFPVLVTIGYWAIWHESDTVTSSSVFPSSWRSTESLCSAEASSSTSVIWRCLLWIRRPFRNVWKVHNRSFLMSNDSLIRIHQRIKFTHDMSSACQLYCICDP